MKPFLKWAGGKRWLVDHERSKLPTYTGKYIEPFLGGGAMFFFKQPARARVSDVNARLIETYIQVRDNWKVVWDLLRAYHDQHGYEFYYDIRDKQFAEPALRAAQFIYLNRSCWNGLYRVNKDGKFNVPIGTKNWIVSPNDDFEAASKALRRAEIECCDFETSIETGESGDLIFVDPPYTVAHNMNGFVKYNENIFSWSDQIRLRDALVRARDRGCKCVITNAAHQSIIDLYADHGEIRSVTRTSIISGTAHARRPTQEALILME